MSQTVCTPSSLPTSFKFNIQGWNGPGGVRFQIQEYIAITALSGAFYGIFIPLCGASIYSLIQLNSRNRRTALILSLALFALFCSTTIYTATTVVTVLQQTFQQVVYNGPYLWEYYGPLNYSTIASFGPSSASENAFLYCSPTTALTINILLGDAIVCWRACVVWRGNRSVMGACIMLLLTTFALGTVDTKYACSQFGDGDSLWQPDPHADGTGGLYQGFSYGVTTTALTFSTNLFATSLVAVKVWQSRVTLKRYVVAGCRVSQLQKALSLFVESGMIYCSLWVVVLAWQAGNYGEVFWSEGDNSFWDIFNVVINSALVPLIAIYPTVVIVLLALNGSHIENGFMKTSQTSAYSLQPLHPLAVTVNTTVTTHRDNRCRGSPEWVLGVGEDEIPSKDGPEVSSAHTTTEERKLQALV